MFSIFISCFAWRAEVDRETKTSAINPKPRTQILPSPNLPLQNGQSCVQGHYLDSVSLGKGKTPQPLNPKPLHPKPLNPLTLNPLQAQTHKLDPLALNPLNTTNPSGLVGGVLHKVWVLVQLQVPHIAEEDVLKE